MSELAAPKGASISWLPMARTAVLVAAVAFAGLGLLVMLAGPALFRAGLLDVEFATAGIEAIARVIFTIGLVCALLGLVVSLIGRKQRGVIVGVVVGVVCGYGAGHLYGQGELRKALPPIWDAQTDWTRPVMFSDKLLAERAAAHAAEPRADAVLPANAGVWAGKSFAAAQAEVYELESLIVRANVTNATATAAKAAERLGWQVVTTDPAAGVVEATSRTFWYGLVSDIAVRITSDGEGARVDIRSTSRDPVADLGSNAAQVEALVNEVALELR